MRPEDRTWSAAQVEVACATLPRPGVVAVAGAVEQTGVAAILVPVMDVSEGAAVLVTKRHTALRAHRDEWVFPGGRVDPADASASAAARREAAEELGVDIHRLRVIGQLDTHGPILSGYLIEVFVGLVAPGPPLAPAASEVAEVRAVVLSQLLRPERSFRAGIGSGYADDQALSRRDRLDLRWYEIEPGAHLWGTQGDILHNLLHHLTGGAHDL